jgi:tetratricopeptide (TPR) repeat protein
MSFNVNESYLNFPPFQEAMGNFQVGKWEEGFAKLAEVEHTFPTEPEIRALRQEMEVRSRINAYEDEESKHNKRQQLTKTILRVLAIFVIAIVGFLAIKTYSGWIQEQATKTQSDITKNWLQLQLAAEFKNANQLIIAGKSDEALSAFENIRAKNPEFPGLSDAIAQAQALKDIEVEYTQAMNLLELGDSAQALSVLQAISEKMPNYRDVSLQIKSLQTQTEMASVLQQADQAFSNGMYEEAVSSYESLRLMNPSFETSHVEENLFQSYVKAAQALLAEPVPSLAVLKKIDDYFSKALALRPLDREALAARTQVRSAIEESMIGDYISQAQSALANAPDSMEAQQLAEQYLGMALAVKPDDPNVLVQFQLARSYIQAINDFSSSKWDSVIEQLEFVMEHQASYANGTALQTLYDAYIARGTDYIAAGEYTMALDDFQRAAVLAQQLPDSDQLAFEAQTMIAEAQGLLNHFQEAVLIYQDAINSTGLRERITALNNSLTDTLSSAEYSTNVGDYTSAFYAYRNLIRNRVKAYNQDTVVTIKSGDYLSMLARRYNTTVAAILSANEMNNQPRLTPDTQLVIPILPK